MYRGSTRKKLDNNYEIKNYTFIINTMTSTQLTTDILITIQLVLMLN